MVDADSGESIREDAYYAYHFEHGPVICDKNRQIKNPVLSGLSLMAFDQDKIESAQQRSEIKQLMRYVLAGHLGHKKLKSRELFRRPKSRNI